MAQRITTRNVPNNFIGSFLEHTSIYESPTSFWKWSAYATISALLNERCYIKTGDRFLFPNMYILLLAESSIHRKGAPVDFSESLIHTVVPQFKIISGRSSVQAVLDELARTETDGTTGKVKKSSAAIFYAAELAASLVSDPEGIGILTDIYDYKTNPYKSRLRTGPCFNLDRIVFSMFSATNEDMIRSLFDASVVKGGFLARNLLVTPNEFREPNSLLRIDYKALKESKVYVIDALTQLNQVYGEMKFPDDAIQEYESWYNPFKKSYERKKESSGIIGRIHTHILKLSIILAANDLTACIQKKHVEEAINECLALLPNYSIFTMSHGKSEISQLGGLVITELISSPHYTRSRKELIRKYWPDGLDGDSLDKLIVTLDSAGMIQQVQTNEGLFLILTKTCLDMVGQPTEEKK